MERKKSRLLITLFLSLFLVVICWLIWNHQLSGDAVSAGNGSEKKAGKESAEQGKNRHQEALRKKKEAAEQKKRMEEIFIKERSAVIYKGSAKKKLVALTFDDGPDDTYTVQILNILKRKQVPATFFVLGKNVLHHPAIAKQIVAEGHTIANHSWCHPFLPKKSPTEVERELLKTHDEVAKITGHHMTLMRPPYGAIQNRKEIVAKNGYWIVNWDVDTNDWKKDRKKEDIQHIVQHKTAPGSIVLMHSAGGDRRQTVAALPEMIRSLRAKGYQLVTVDKLLGVAPYHSLADMEGMAK